MLTRPKWLTAVAAAVYVFLYVPIVVLVLFSFEESKLAVHWTGFTLKWYHELFADEHIVRALLNSLTVAGIAVAAWGAMGTLGAVWITPISLSWHGTLPRIVVYPDNHSGNRYGGSRSHAFCRDWLSSQPRHHYRLAHRILYGLRGLGGHGSRRRTRSTSRGGCSRSGRFAARGVLQSHLASDHAGSYSRLPARFRSIPR